MVSTMFLLPVLTFLLLSTAPIQLNHGKEAFQYPENRDLLDLQPGLTCEDVWASIKDVRSTLKRHNVSVNEAPFALSPQHTSNNLNGSRSTGKGRALHLGAGGAGVDLAPIQLMYRALCGSRPSPLHSNTSEADLTSKTQRPVEVNKPLHRQQGSQPQRQQFRQRRSGPASKVDRGSVIDRQRRRTVKCAASYSAPVAPVLTNGCLFTEPSLTCSVSQLSDGTCREKGKRSSVSTLMIEMGPYTYDGINDTNINKTAAALGPCRLVLVDSGYSQHIEDILGGGDWLTVKEVIVQGIVDGKMDLSTFRGLQKLSRVNLSSNFLHTIEAGGARLPQVDDLYLTNNRLSQVPTAVFQAMPNLSSLHLSQNHISDISQEQLNSSRISILDLSSNWLSTIPQHAFVSLRNLAHLSLADNFIKDITPDAFRPSNAIISLQLDRNYLNDTLLFLKQFSNLRSLSLTNNHITKLSQGGFSVMTHLEQLDLSFNNLSTFNRTTFCSLTALKQFLADDNHITSLSAGIGNLFASNIEMELASFRNNKITAIPQGTPDSAARIRKIYLSGNRLKRLNLSLSISDDPSLCATTELDVSDNELESFHVLQGGKFITTLGLSNNAFEVQPDLFPFPLLEELYLSNHSIRSVDLDAIANLTNLRILSMDAMLGPTAMATITESQSWNLTVLENLGIGNIALPQAFVDHLCSGGDRYVNLRRLRMGWPTMARQRVSITCVCDLLDDAVTEVSLINTDYKSITLCDRHLSQLHTVLLQENNRLESVNIRGAPQLVNVSSCPNLEVLEASATQVLDISGTNLQPQRTLCSKEGLDKMVARNMVNSEFGDNQATADFLRACVSTTTMFDVSENKWLNRPALILPDDPHQWLPSAGTTDPSRAARNPPTQNVQTANTPIWCTASLVSLEVREETAATTQLGYMLQCGCAVNTEDNGGRCVARKSKHSSPWLIGLASSLGAAACVLIALLVSHVREKRKYEIEVDDLKRENERYQYQRVPDAGLKVTEMRYDNERWVTADPTKFSVSEHDTHCTTLTITTRAVDRREWHAIETSRRGTLRCYIENREWQRHGAENHVAEDDDERIWLLFNEYQPNRHLEIFVVLQDVAAGMKTLYKVQRTHRNLCALNILLFEHRGKLRGRIAHLHDFPYTTMICSNNFDRVCVPAALEREFGDDHFTYAPQNLSQHAEKDDVFRFGMIMWELAINGAISPFAVEPNGQLTQEGVGRAERLEETFNNFTRIEAPVPDSLRTFAEAYKALMLECLDGDSSQRPDFENIGQRLRTMRRPIRGFIP